MPPQFKKPFLKWAGNKFRILPRIRSLLPPDDHGYTAYAEPFLGAGSVFLNLMADYRPVYLNDFNRDLIRVFEALQTDPATLIERARALFVDGNEEERYYERRDAFNESELSSVERAAYFLYFNRHGFNGLCRYNQSGGFNVPFGRYTSPYFPAAELEAVADVATQLPADTFTSGDFGLVFDRVLSDPVGPGRFVVYCDPPYAPLDQSSNFTAYAAGTFSWDDQVRLARRAEEAASRGAWVLLSNHDTPAVRELYHEAAVLSFDVRRSIGASAETRGMAPELIGVFAPPQHTDVALRVVREARGDRE